MTHDRSGPERIPDTEPSLPDLFLGVSRALRRGWADALAPWGISPHHARALRTIGHLTGEDRAPRLGDLAEALRIAPRSATEVVDGLEQKGLVSREPDPSDRRATCVRLTDDGMQVLREFRAARDEGAEAYFAVLSETRRRQLRALLLDLEAAHRSDP